MPSKLSSIRFSSLVRPGTAVLRADRPDARVTTPLLPPADDAVLDEGSEGLAQWMRVAATTGGIAAAAVETETPDDGGRCSIASPSTKPVRQICRTRRPPWPR